VDFKGKVILGLKWSILAKAITQIFSWISTFLVIRMLSPEDYGIMALAMTFVLFGTLFSSGGFITSIVKTQMKDKQQSSQMFTISIIVNSLIAFIVILFTEDIGSFYNNQQLQDVLVVMALASLLNSFLIVPGAYLDIDMNFKGKAICDSVGALVAAAVALIMAYQGAAFWALVYSYVAQQCIRVIGYQIIAKSNYFFTVNFQGSSSILKFAYSNQLNGLLWFGYNQIDTVLIGKFLGINILGIYNVAKDVASLPMMKVAAIMNQVGFSAFASLKEDKSAAGYYLEKSLKLIAIFAFPIFLGISSIASEIILLLVGDKWLSAAPIISVLCFVFPFRMMNTNIQLYANALNRPKFNLQNTFIMSLIMIALMLWATQISLLVTALTWFAGFVCVFFIILLRLRANFSLQNKVVLVWVTPFLMSFTMWLSIYLANSYLLEYEVNSLVSMILKMILGAIIIIPLYYKLYGNELNSLLKMK
jgi:teichuronic acid exporter